MVSCTCPHARQNGVSEPNLSKTWATAPVRHVLSFFPSAASIFTLIPVSLVTLFSFFFLPALRRVVGRKKVSEEKEQITFLLRGFHV